jgi:hypothetical protein
LRSLSSSLVFQIDTADGLMTSSSFR